MCGGTELKLPLQTSQTQDPDLPENSEIMGCGRHFTSKATLEEHVRTVHLGMNSKRQERNKKRRAEKAIDTREAEAGSGPKTKRKRKIREEKSSIAELTGSASLALAAGFEPDSAFGSQFDGPAYATEYDHDFGDEFDAQPFLQQGYNDFYFRHNQGEQGIATPSLGVDVNGLATSGLVDPVLLSS